MLVLERLLGIDKENMANQVNLTYTRSAGEAEASVASGESQCCFLLNPTRVEEIGAVAQAGEKMPQKSTYFYPKLLPAWLCGGVPPLAMPRGPAKLRLSGVPPLAISRAPAKLRLTKVVGAGTDNA